MGEVPAEQSWSFPRKLLFRFVCAYFVIYILPFPVAEFGRLELLIRQKTETLTPNTTLVLFQAVQKYGDAWHEIVQWAGKNVLKLDQPITIRPNGSGDTTWNYVQVFCFAVMAAGVALLWTLVDWRTTDYSRVLGALRIYVRYYVAYQMIVYGTIKVVPAQFPPPALDRLVQPFGDASPMGLAWTFVGASSAYEIFSGAGELLGGLLLTTRRTTLLGALVSAGVMAHVVAINFSYDVPVKLFSMHLLVMALWLMIPDLRWLFDVFVLRRSTEIRPIEPLFRWPWLDWLAVALRTAIVGGFVYMQINSSIVGRDSFAQQKTKGQFYGVWAVEQFTVDGTDRPALVTEPDRWRRFIVDYPGTAGVQLTNASRVRFRMQIHPASESITLTKPDFSDWKADLTYSQPDDDHLTLEGSLDGHTIKAVMHKENLDEFLSQFRLLNRGFHWINEYPFNR
jgi:hypothetical protein